MEAKRVRNKVGKDLKKLRADFLKQQQEAYKTDPKKFWKSISEIIPNKKQKNGEIWLHDKTTSKDIPLRDSADQFNTFFTNVGHDLAKGFSDRWEYFGEQNPNSIDPIATNTEEVMGLCREIDIMKSSGMDNLSARLCKDAFLALSEQLVHMFNCSLRVATFRTPGKLPR